MTTSEMWVQFILSLFTKWPAVQTFGPLWCQGQQFEGGKASEDGFDCITSSAELPRMVYNLLGETHSQTLVKSPEKYPESCPCLLHWHTTAKAVWKYSDPLRNRHCPPEHGPFGWPLEIVSQTIDVRTVERVLDRKSNKYWLKKLKSNW